MKNLKTLINVLLIVLPTSGAASTMSCDRNGYRAYEYLGKYNSTLNKDAEIVRWDYNDGKWSGAKNGTVTIQNSTETPIVVKLKTVACEDTKGTSWCDTGLTHDNGEHTIGANSTSVINVTYAVLTGKAYGGFIMVGPESYILSSKDTNKIGNLTVNAVTMAASATTSYGWRYSQLWVNPRVLQVTSLTLPDTLAYDTRLDTGVDANKPFSLENSTNVPITLKVGKTFGDSTFVTVGNETLSQGDTSRPFTGMTTVGIYLPEHAEPGTKSASVTATWTCP
ncbi:hypothetical protein CF635_003546 [Enterobacter hormaechei]|nr:hypothetical protein [Enterobacter hormaechei]